MDYMVKTCIGDIKLSNLLKEIKKDIKLSFKNNVKELKLFGSYARGNYSNDSDIDIYMLYDESTTEDIDDKISEISVEYQIKYGIMINIYDMSINYYNKFKNISPLIKNIEKEGVNI